MTNMLVSTVISGTNGKNIIKGIDCVFDCIMLLLL